MSHPWKATSNGNRKWSPGMINAIRHLWTHEGLSMSAIGEQLGMTRSAIAGIIHRFNMTGLKGTNAPDIPKCATCTKPLEPFEDRKCTACAEEAIAARFRAYKKAQYKGVIRCTQPRCTATVQPGKQFCARHNTEHMVRPNKRAGEVPDLGGLSSSSIV